MDATAIATTTALTTKTAHTQLNENIKITLTMILFSPSISLFLISSRKVCVSSRPELTPVLWLEEKR